MPGSATRRLLVARGRLVGLARPRASDRVEFIAAVLGSRELHGKWVEPPATAREFRAFVRHGAGRDRYALLVRDRSNGRLVGVVNVANVVGGSFANATLGYYGFTGAAGGGRMTEAVALAVGWSFDRLGLHRLEANIQPANAPSRALVERLGFRYEGHSPRMLLIAGVWRDHDRYAVTAEEWRPRP